MKKILLFLFTLCAFQSVWAQDTLQLRSGQELAVKVLEINPTEVIYKRYDNPEGPTIVVLKAEVAQIRYANGTSEEFALRTSEKAPDFAPVVRKEDAMNMYNRGRMDALSYYQGNGALWGTYAACPYPPAGLLTGIVVGAVAPSPRSFYTPNPELLKDPRYVRGYRAQAHRRKVGKAAAGFGLGVATWLLIIVVVASGQ